MIQDLSFKPSHASCDKRKRKVCCDVWVFLRIVNTMAGPHSKQHSLLPPLCTRVRLHLRLLSDEEEELYHSNPAPLPR